MSLAPPTTRVPNLWHLLLFLTLMVVAFGASEALVVLGPGHGRPVELALKDPRLQLIANIVTYAIGLGMAFVAMPVFWARPFPAGIQWNSRRVRGWMPMFGLALGFAMLGVEVFLPHPKDLPVEAMFRNPATIWLLVGFGVVMGPLFEEIVFRGFLLPGIAIAVDYMRIPRDPDPVVSLERLAAWRMSPDYSRAALAIATAVTSLLFGLMHAPQLGYTWPAVALLAGVSVVLCLVRIRTGSVAASTVVHGFYNLAVFLTLFAGTGGFRHLDKI